MISRLRYAIERVFALLGLYDTRALDDLDDLDSLCSVVSQLVSDIGLSGANAKNPIGQFDTKMKILR